MVVGIVGDIHAPFQHPNYLPFILETFRAWRVDRIHIIGDVVDQHALGFWDHNPDGLSASSELDEALDAVELWHKKIGKATVSVGNHDARQFRVAHKAGIPARYLRDYKEVFGTPLWDWDLEHNFEGVIYEHGTGSSGKFAAFNRAIQRRNSVVMGHCHSGGGVLYHANTGDRIFGLNVGCGIDVDRYAFEYGKQSAIRPTLGCGVVEDGSLAVFEPMPIGRREKYSRRKRRKKC